MSARRLLPALLALSVSAPLAHAANQPGTEAMAAHRAAYRLTLDRARDNADIARASGAMLFEVVDACEGWATRQRFTLVVTDRDGDETETASDYSTYETKDGRSLRFSLTQSSNGAVSQRISGEAEVTEGGGRVRYADPEPKEVALPPGTLLPMLHTVRALATARGGQRLLVSPLFDGTSADGAQDSTTVISGWTTPQANERFPALAALASARMRVAFFDRTPSAQGGGASEPDYEVGLRYWENGVADELRMEFGEFSVAGRMEELTLLPGGC